MRLRWALLGTTACFVLGALFGGSLMVILKPHEELLVSPTQWPQRRSHWLPVDPPASVCVG